MARKKAYNYFEAMAHLADNAQQAGKILAKILSSEDYSLETLLAKSDQIHQLEHDGDDVVKETMRELYVSFITPIDREDIVQITDRLDDILDGINSVTYLFEHLVVTELRPELEGFLALVLEALNGVDAAVKEFAKFKNSKQLIKYIEQVNLVESEGDRYYSNSLKNLFTNEKDPIEIIKWKDIFDKLESVLDDCESSVDIIEGLVIKNS
ncbi:DUF47 family protein [Enterococcus hirae]|jgi:predicted phosphate transport protein (TIGR00153 family)|nr:DUF47 family protein [Enterococcaceae bacterium]MCI1919898.1 DUF47 family protein [Enterococcaceae bacterium]MDM8213263.1 DUF47 family protein [Enterococcus hirae]